MAKSKKKKEESKEETIPLSEIERRSYGLLLTHRAQHEKVLMSLSNQINENSLLVLKGRGLSPEEYKIDIAKGVIVKRIMTPAERAIGGKNKKQAT